jgi:hypothetical protein
VIEKNIIYQFVSAADAAAYLLHFKVATLFTFAMSALQISLVPHMIDVLKKQKFAKFMQYNVIVATCVMAATVLFFAISPYLLKFFSPTHQFYGTLMITLLSVQALIVTTTLGETIFIYSEKYKIILALNAFQVLLFISLVSITPNKNVDTITQIALTSLIAKLTLTIALNYCHFWQNKKIR